jgi:DNA-binding CsgD family transcriptional regulator
MLNGFKLQVERRQGGVIVGVLNPKRQQFQRLESKTLDARFLTEIQQGLNCSPFEAEAVLQVVKEVYVSLFAQEGDQLHTPGRISLLAVAADEPAGKPIAKCEKLTLCLTLHRGAEDDLLLQREGADVFRRARIPDLCQEALSKGGVLTREDLAFRIFLVSTRTISRDLAILRREKPETPIPLRSTVQDIGPVLTHRVEIVRLALDGKTMSEICQSMYHSPTAVANYVNTFTRVAQLAERQLHPSQIAFLLRRGRSLVDQYLDLLKECKQNPNYDYHLKELLSIGFIGTKKKAAQEEVCQ